MVHGHKSQLPPLIYIPKLADKSIAWGKTFSGAKVMFLRVGIFWTQYIEEILSSDDENILVYSIIFPLNFTFLHQRRLFF